MDTKSIAEDMQNMTDEEVGSSEKDLRIIAARIAKIVELIQKQSRIAEKITDRLTKSKSRGRSYWLLSAIAGLGLLLNKNLRASILQQAVTVAEHPLTADLAKIAADLIWPQSQRKPSRHWWWIMALAFVICYGCLMAAAYLALKDLFGALIALLIFAGLHLALGLIATYFSRKRSE